MPKVSQCSSRIEEEVSRDGFRLIAGIDEVGRGALAGPVVAAAVILDLTSFPNGLDDSKRLTRKQRERLYVEISKSAVAISVIRIESDEIDNINIHKASLKAMSEAVAALKPEPDYLLIDGFALKSVGLPQRAIIKGDTLSVSIAAASIIAKVTRDRIMADYESQWPGYGFSRNVGYATASHLTNLRQMGPTPIHRRSFSGVLPPAQLELPMAEETLQKNVFEVG
jgi:ribonuclease HII